MTIAGTSNLDYIVKATVNNLRAISMDNGYYTNVREVIEPDFWLDSDKDMVMAAQQGATLFVWMTKDRPAPELKHLGGTRDFIVATIEIMGAVKQADALQEAVRRLASDVRRVMRQNVRRNYGGGTGTNDYGRDTQQSEEMDYFYGEISPSTTAGVFRS